MAVSGLASNFIGANGSNFTAGRSRGVSRITIHHMAGIMSSNDCGRVFQTPGRGASAHYGIGVNGDIAAYVDESNTAWSDANWDSNCQTVSIECSNRSAGGDWPISDATWNSLVRLVRDIAERNGLLPLAVGRNLFGHRDFAATTCPGDYLYSRLQQLANIVNAGNGGAAPAPQPAPAPSNGKSVDQVAQEVIAGYWGNGADRERNLTNAGYDYGAIQAKVNELLGYGTPNPTPNLDGVAQAVIRGDYGNGDDRRRNLEAAGFNYDAVQARVNELLEVGGGGAAAVSPSRLIEQNDRVALINWVDYNGTPLAQTRDSYIVSELIGDRAVLTADGAVYAAVNVNNLRRI